MITRFTQWLQGYTRSSRKQMYIEQIDHMEDGDMRPEEFPVMLKEFWRTAYLPDFVNLDIRQLMGVRMQIRHASISALIDSLHEVNDLVAHENDDALMRIAKNEFLNGQNIYLDAYFVDALKQGVDVKQSIVRLQGLVMAHCGLLEGVSESHYQRLLNRLYYDILTVTRSLAEQIEG